PTHRLAYPPWSGPPQESGHLPGCREKEQRAPDTQKPPHPSRRIFRGNGPQSEDDHPAAVWKTNQILSWPRALLSGRSPAFSTRRQVPCATEGTSAPQPLPASTDRARRPHQEYASAPILRRKGVLLQDSTAAPPGRRHSQPGSCRQNQALRAGAYLLLISAQITVVRLLSPPLRPRCRRRWHPACERPRARDDFALRPGQ